MNVPEGEGLWVTITNDYGTDEVVVRTHTVGIGPCEERVDVGMNPTWPSSGEIIDMVTAAVRLCLERELEEIR